MVRQNKSNPPQRVKLVQFEEASHQQWFDSLEQAVAYAQRHGFTRWDVKSADGLVLRSYPKAA